MTDRIERDRQQLERELAEVRAGSSTALQALDAAREELRRTQTRPDAGPAATARAAERVAGREAQVEAAHAAIRRLRLMLEIEHVERTMWELRFAAYDSRRVDTLRASHRRLEIFTRRLELWKDYERQQMDVSSSQIELQETRVRNLAPDSALL